MSRYLNQIIADRYHVKSFLGRGGIAEVCKSKQIRQWERICRSPGVCRKTGY